MIHLKEIDHNNWIQCIELDVAPEQRQFVNPNIFSLAEAFVHSGERKDADEYYRCLPFAVYDDEIMVGFAMITYEAESDYDDKPGYELYRLMIAKEHQGKGYGKQAVERMLEIVRTFPCGKAGTLYAQWHPDNLVSEHLMKAVGFNVVDEAEDGAVVARLTL